MSRLTIAALAVVAGAVVAAIVFILFGSVDVSRPAPQARREAAPPPVMQAPAPPRTADATPPTPLAPRVAEAVQPPPATGPRLALPVDCTLGRNCFIQNYVDRDASPQRSRDYVCGPLTYEGHKGTDFALPDLAAMQRGVVVLAAATGRVRNVRDGVADVSIRAENAPDTRDRECGNGVAIAHGDGWETLYCHMKRGSIPVRPGQEVHAGDAIGMIGLSGQTEFPHLHFQVSHRGNIVDPFDGEPQASACGLRESGLWERSAPYAAGGAATAGFAGEKPIRTKATQGSYGGVPRRAGFLAFWVEAYGIRQGDVNRLVVIGPNGQATLSADSQPSPRTQARQFHAIGRDAPAGGWPAGRYRGEYRLVRNGEVVAETFREVDLR